MSLDDPGSILIRLGYYEITWNSGDEGVIECQAGAVGQSGWSGLGLNARRRGGQWMG